MRNEPLSDVEKASLCSAFGQILHRSGTSQEDLSLIYGQINRLLRTRSTGADLCARPISARDDKDVNETCFALGYIDKIHSYIQEIEKRNDENKLKAIKKYISQLRIEIKKFFS